MWDSPLCSMNMFYCHWLIKKLLSANGLTEYYDSMFMELNLYMVRSMREIPFKCINVAPIGPSQFSK